MGRTLISIIVFVVEKCICRYDLNKNGSVWLGVDPSREYLNFFQYFFNDYGSVGGLVDTQLEDLSIDMSSE